MNLLSPSKTTALAVSLLLLAGCKASPKKTSEVDSLLKTVSYDTSVPVAPESNPAATITPINQIDTTSTFTDRVSSVRKTLGDAVRATARGVLISVSKAALGFDDDDDDDDDDDNDNDDDSTPRGRADQNLQQWIDDRDRWRRDP